MEDQDIVRVHVIAPEGFDNPGQPTGGNIYDRRVCAGLAEAGWEVLVATVGRISVTSDAGRSGHQRFLKAGSVEGARFGPARGWSSGRS